MQQLIKTEDTNLTKFNDIQQEVEKARAIQEVQGSIIMARQFPRNEQTVLNKLAITAKSMKFAEQAIYAYPRGGSMITGLSIRAAETLANYWGNLLYGTKILSQKITENSSEIMAYCWDMETNVRSEKVFRCSLIRETKSGGYALTSGRDIYEKEANDSSRRLRSCILAIVPTYISEEFKQMCENTLIGSTEKTLQERTEDLLSKFEEIGISKAIIEKKMGVTVDKLVAKNIVMLGYIYNSIKSNYAPATQFFDIETEEQKQVNNALKKANVRLKRTDEAKNEADK